ncbi:MAG: hypothetical protein ACJAZC_002892 [Cryomorphaceae bacterium]|jgi:hypothetical protein
MRRLNLTLTAGLLFLISCISTSLSAQENCALSEEQSNGYSTSISNVTENSDGTYTIVVILENDGCSGCKKLNRFSVEADPGTYSDVDVQLLSGDFTFANIDLGPSIGGGLTGFKINNTNGMGNGQAASFSVTYTLTGGLQEQRFIAKAGPSNLIATFAIEDFEAVLDCLNPTPTEIIPYYDPLGAGKVNNIIGYELTSLYVSYEDGSFVQENVADIYRVVGESVLISVLAQSGQYETALSELTTSPYNLTIPIGDPNTNTIQGLYPIDNLLLLNDRPDILVAASPVFPALGNVGLVTTQGDEAMRSSIARDVFKVDGSGIKVGVISDSYNTKLGDPASDDIIKGDLPGAANPNYTMPVDVVMEYPYGEASDEGRAMMQIVHDIAPGAELAFRTGFAGPADFAIGISELQQAGCDVIVDDITYINEPFFRDGIVAQAVDDAAEQGVAYFSAAGNFGTNSWESNFKSVPAPDGLPSEAHNFAPDGSPVDISQSVQLYAGEYTVVLQWDDGTPGLNTSSDFDIYLANNDDIAFFGFNRANIGSSPIEVLPFTVVADSTESNFQIIRAETAEGYDASQPVILKYIVFRGTLKINEYGGLNASTITGQANAEGAMAVGAVLYTNTPEFGEPAPTVASFSSRGSTPVNGVLRAKPEFCAPNVVNTSVDLGGGFDFEGDGFPNFIGTSAAAPHAAGVAALVLQAREKYYENSLSPTELKGILQNTALDMYGSGYDVESGAGYLLADSALNNIANPTAFLIVLTYDTTLVPGFDEIPITITGEYLTEGSEVYFNGQPLETSSTLQGDTAITVIIPAYGDSILFPDIQVYNPSQVGTNGLDGGLSNTVYLTTKSTIFVDIQNTGKIYGENIPSFTADYFLATPDGNEPIEVADLNAEELDRIQAINLTTIANPLSNAGLWAIEPDPNDPLNPLSIVEAIDSLDVALLERFDFVFKNGLMTIDPLDLIINPRDTSFIYNDSLIGFNFDYLFNQNDSLDISEENTFALTNALLAGHETVVSDRSAALVRGTALVNDLGEPLLTEGVLLNKSFVVSTDLRASRGTALVNGGLIDPSSFYDAATLPNEPASFSRGTALVNGSKLVRATALVNTFNEDGELLEEILLTNSSSLTNSSGELSTSTFNAKSNAETIVILGEGDIAILSGDSVGFVGTESINLVTGETVGTHFILPGAFLSNNFNVSYLPGNLTVLPDTATIIIDEESLTQVYDGLAKQIDITTLPDSIVFTITYNGVETLPLDAGLYEIEVTVTDSNYVGSAAATLNILQAEASVEIAVEDLIQVYDGSEKAVSVNTVPQNIATSVTYDGTPDLPVNAGTYAVEVVVVDPNYFGTAVGSLTIEKAEALVNLTNLTQGYDGTAKTVSASTEPENLTINFTYDGSTEAPINAGSYEVIAEVANNNYFGSSTDTLTVEKAVAIIEFSDLEQIYDGSGQSVSVSTMPSGLNVILTYDGSSTLPVNTGSYLVDASIDDTNYLGNAGATLIINPATAGISFDGIVQTYDGSAKSITVVTSPSDLSVTIAYNGLADLPVNAGEYTADVSVEDENYVGTASELMIINPAEAVASSEGIYFIDEGDDLPDFSVTYSGFVNGENESVVTSVTYELSPEYAGDAGTYEVMPVAFAGNYTFTAVNGTFYVNPSGPGTKQIKPNFLCYQELSTPDENGYSFVAYFNYVNQNQEDVYIPIGQDNVVFGTASVDISDQPTLFLSGGGMVTMPFDGQSFTWQITSRRKNGIKGAIPANTSNSTCNGANKSNNTPFHLAEAITVYPNPSSGLVFIHINEEIKESVKLQLFDSMGRELNLETTTSDGVFELDLSSFKRGLYLLRASIGNEIEVKKVVKQ